MQGRAHPLLARDHLRLSNAAGILPKKYVFSSGHQSVTPFLSVAPPPKEILDPPLEKSNIKLTVPQGSVPGPRCFLLYINGIGNSISSNLKLFADDTLLNGLVHNASDALHLERDLDNLVI